MLRPRDDGYEAEGLAHEIAGPAQEAKDAWLVWPVYAYPKFELMSSAAEAQYV